jgi:hypothetical protein
MSYLVASSSEQLFSYFLAVISHALEWLQSTTRDKTLLLTTSHIKKSLQNFQKINWHTCVSMAAVTWSAISQANSGTGNNNAFRK